MSNGKRIKLFVNMISSETDVSGIRKNLFGYKVASKMF